VSAKPFLFQFSRGPDRESPAIQEGVEAALMAVAFEQPVTLLFRGEGRVLLEPAQQVLVPGLKELLELAVDTWVETSPGLAADTSAVATSIAKPITRPIEAEQCADLLGAYPVVMRF
jgi:hypothetical protein